MTALGLRGVWERWNIQVKSLSHLKAKHVEYYVDARLSKRTVQNEMSALRNISSAWQVGRNWKPFRA
ncbi:hypothetical protein CKY02_21875 [Photorhabdus bodei]|uniref:Putative integrase N-terminal domain-containing protein n=1 Tax=Photorhabdus bodei TaxID=2029681 RepID=A0A329WR63_9GAMM|nr:hypothetical protein CKY02_21875 [Photorhabdus bodei]